MNISQGIFVAVAVQAILLAVLAFRLGKHCIGKLGFLLMASTFFYHGFNEIVQALFPENDYYRSLTDDDSLISFILLITGGMILFTVAYLVRLDRVSPSIRLQDRLDNLKQAYLLDGKVLLAMSVPSFILVFLHESEFSGYWIPGLADQFIYYLLILALVTLCLKWQGRQLSLLLLAFGLLIVAAGSRTMVALETGVALVTLVRYGIRVRARSVAITGICLAAAFVVISTSRSTYGRFNSGESFVDRLEILSTTIDAPQNVSDGSSAVLSDTVYRFDGNSFGALILEKQRQGYGITGLTQLFWTVAYETPSFIYRGKADLDDFLRNEQGYDNVFYSLESLNYVSDIWSLLLCYAGPFGLVAAFLILGWLVASLDNWLNRNGTVLAYFIGIGSTIIALNIEEGFSGIIYVVRAFTVLTVAALLLRRVSQGKKRRLQHSSTPEGPIPSAAL